MSDTKIVNESSSDSGVGGVEENEAACNQFLTFTVADDTYGLEILKIVEIIRVVEITEIPESYEYIKGIINLRGKIIPVMDIRLRFGMQEKETDERTCIIVAMIGEVQVGIIVDSVSEVCYVGDEQMEEMPNVAKALDQNMVRGIGKTENGIVILIALDKLLQNQDLSKFET